jgi:hypothetical protein
MVLPVIFPPGRARLATSPVFRGSPMPRAQVGELLSGASVREPILDDDVLAFHIAQLAQPLLEALDERLRRRSRS